MRRATLLVAPVVAALAVPGVAQASRIVRTGTAGPAAEVFPMYKAARGERNRVQVTLGRKGITIVDNGVRRIERERGRHPLCRPRGAHRFFCKGQSFVDVRLGNRADSVRFTPGGDGSPPTTTDPVKLAEDYEDNEGAPTDTAFVYGGKGNDSISGSSEGDYIDPGPGRDTVDARGGPDTISVKPDGVRDSIDGGGATDSLFFYGRSAVTVDLAAGRGGGDRLAGVERVHGTSRNDTLLGTGGPDALYGEAGADRVDGRDGNDLVAGDSPVSRAGANTVIAGPGDDVVDARGSTLVPTTTVDCGPGDDREAGDVDDLLDSSCESAAYRVPLDYLGDEQPFYAVGMKIAPVARTASSATFEVPCPTNDDVPYRHSACKGMLALERPPGDETGGAPAAYGNTAFNLDPGERQNVRVTLNSAGQSAVASAQPVAVHLTADLVPPSSGGESTSPPKADFGWQEVLGP